MLYLFYEGAQPIGIFDAGIGAENPTTGLTIDKWQGGMIGKLAAEDYTGTHVIPLGDGFDEMKAGHAHNIKTVIIPATHANSHESGPYCIIDDGSTGYGTTYGHQFDNDPSNQYKYFHSWNNGKLVGPNTIAGSGKVTGWITPGIYGTDYYDTTTIDLASIVAGTLAPGTPLGISADATITTTGAGHAFGSGQGVFFVSFLGDPSYVSTSFTTASGILGGDTATPVMLFMWK